MNNTIMRSIAMQAAYARLSDTRVVGTVTLTSALGNAATVYLKGDTGDDVPLAPGEWHTFERINLAAIEAKGTAGDILTVVGGTW